MQLTAENILQQIRSKTMVDQLSLEIIGTIAISIPQEDNTNISIDAQISFLLQQLEDDKVQNLEDEEHMIMRYGDLSTMMQQQE